VPTLELASTAPTSRFGGGQVVIVAGLDNDVLAQATNPLHSAFVGVADLYLNGGTVNRTHFELALAPGEKRAFPVRITASADARGLSVQSRVEGTAGGADVCAQGGSGGQVAPPVSIQWVSPAPDAAMATLESVTLAEGNGFGGEGSYAFGASAGHVQVRATNVANATSSTFYLLARSNELTLGEGTPVPPLAPGASVVLDLGAIPPRSPECAGPNPSRGGCGPMTFLMVGSSDRAGVEQQGPPAVEIETSGGVVTSTRPVALTLADTRGLVPLVEAPPTLALGKPAVVVVNVTNYGSSTDVNPAMRLSFVPPFRARYDVQGEEATTFAVTTPPGASVARSASFTPLVSGRWEILVQFLVSGEPCCVVNAFTVDIPGPVDVSVPASSAPVAKLGETARTPILVRTTTALPAATLRITTAPQSGSGEGGPRRFNSGPAVVGGLSQTLVTAAPASIPLGDLAAGAAVWSNATVTARASGVYNVVPYVVAGGFAYTGTPPATSQNGPTQAVPEFTPQYTIAFDADRIPVVLAWAPAAIVLAGAVALFVGRRMLVK
jgi:hypothetical protein